MNVLGGVCVDDENCGLLLGRERNGWKWTMRGRGTCLLCPAWFYYSTRRRVEEHKILDWERAQDMIFVLGRDEGAKYGRDVLCLCVM
jgi:hypothetical protein